MLTICRNHFFLRVHSCLVNLFGCLCILSKALLMWRVMCMCVGWGFYDHYVWLKELGWSWIICNIAVNPTKNPPVCDMFVLPLLSCKGIPPFPDTEFGCTAYLVRNSTSGFLHPPTATTRRGHTHHWKYHIISIVYLKRPLTPLYQSI